MTSTMTMMTKMDMEVRMKAMFSGLKGRGRLCAPPGGGVIYEEFSNVVVVLSV